MVTNTRTCNTRNDAHPTNGLFKTCSAREQSTIRIVAVPDTHGLLDRLIDSLADFQISSNVATFS